MKGEYKPTIREKNREGAGGFTGIVFVPNVVERTPPYVEEVLPDSPAAKAGFKPDDLIVYVDGEPVASIAAFNEISSTHAARHAAEARSPPRRQAGDGRTDAGGVAEEEVSQPMMHSIALRAAERQRPALRSKTPVADAHGSTMTRIALVLISLPHARARPSRPTPSTTPPSRR